MANILQVGRGTLKILETVYRSSRGDYLGYKCEMPRAENSVLPPRLVFVKTNNPDSLTGHSLAHETGVHRAMGGAPGIVPLLSAWVAKEQPSRYFIMTEYSPHGDLDALIKRHGRLGERDARLVIWQLFQGLEAMHRRGYAHLDIKPSNWLIMDNLPIGLFGGIIDFGMTQAMSPLAGHFIRKGWGTPGFTSPEVDNGLVLALPDRADIYSAGCFLFYILTGKFAYDLSQATRLRLHRFNEIHQVCSPPALDFLLSLLHQDPMARPTAAQAMTHPWFALLLEEQDTLAMSYPPGPCAMIAVRPPNAANAPAIDPAAEPEVEVPATSASEAPETSGEAIRPRTWQETVEVAHRALHLGWHEVMATLLNDEGFVDEPEPTPAANNGKEKKRRKVGPRRELYKNQIRFRVTAARMRRHKQARVKAVAEKEPRVEDASKKALQDV